MLPTSESKCSEESHESKEGGRQHGGVVTLTITTASDSGCSGGVRLGIDDSGVILSCHDDELDRLAICHHWVALEVRLSLPSLEEDRVGGINLSVEHAIHGVVARARCACSH